MVPITNHISILFFILAGLILYEVVRDSLRHMKPFRNPYLARSELKTRQLETFYERLERELDEDTPKIQPFKSKIRSDVLQYLRKNTTSLADSGLLITNPGQSRQASFAHRVLLNTDELPQCAKAKEESHFLMVFMGHSGSSAILSEVKQHSRFHITSPEPVDHGEYQYNSDPALRYAEEYFANTSSFGMLGGFKLRPWHIQNNPEEWRALVRKHKIRIIWQFRKNFFKQSVGGYTAHYLNDSSAIEGIEDNVSPEERCRRGGPCPFEIKDIPFLHGEMVRAWKNDRSIRDSVFLLTESPEEMACVLPVPYEDYLYNRESTMQNIFNFLGVHIESHAPNRYKATNDNICKTVTNYQTDVCTAFYGCASWRWMLEDFRNNCTCRHLKAAVFRDDNPFCSMDKAVNQENRLSS